MDARATIDLGASPITERNEHRSGTAEDATPYHIRRTSDLIDLNGDGFPDLFFRSEDGWRVRIGTGAGFGPQLSIFSHHDDFEISQQTEFCNDVQSETLAGLVDFDGDGQVDLVQGVPGGPGELRISRLGGAQSKLSASRLRDVHNGHRGHLGIKY